MQRDLRNVPSRRNQPYEFGLSDPASFWDISPWQMMRRMQEDMDRIFSNYLTTPAGQGANQSLLSPSMDISETDGALHVEVDLPGFKQDDISIEMHDNRLAIKAETRQEETPENKQYHRRERRYGRYEQVLTLPQNIDPEKIMARFTDGVLTVEVPKTDRSLNTGRRIAIQGTPSQGTLSQGATPEKPRSIRSSNNKAGDTQASPPPTLQEDEQASANA